MEAPSSSSLALAKKTGALIFFIGCAVGLCIAEILVAVANQKAQQEARKASLDYIAQVRNASNNASLIATTTVMPDKHVAVLHTGKGNEVIAAHISKPNITLVHAKVVKTHRHRKVKHRKKDEDDDDDDDIEDFIGNPFRIITSDDHERKGILVHPCKGKHCKPKSTHPKRRKRAVHKKHLEDDEDTEFEERDVPRHRHKHLLHKKIHKALADVKNDHGHHATGHKKPKLPKEHEAAPSKVVEESEVEDDKHVKKTHKTHEESGHRKTDHSKGKRKEHHKEKGHGAKGSHVKVTTTEKTTTSTTTKPTTSTRTTTTVKTTIKPKIINLPLMVKDFQIDKMDMPAHKKRISAAHESRACRKIMKDLDTYERDEKYKSEELMIVSFRDGVDEVQNLLHTWVRTPVHVMEGLVFVALSVCLLLYWVDDSLQSRLRRIGLNI